MEKIRVQLKENSYDVLFENGELDKVAVCVRPLVKGENVMIVTDDNVAGLYLERVKKSFLAQGFKTFETVVSNGEKFKTPDTYLQIINALAKENFLRSDTVVALGGGVVGDMAGFAATTYMRGVNFVQIPTTLLAMIDSSVGGKVGVDLPEGKNLLGAFYQPKLVFVDVKTLDTLPEREWQNGLGEGLKYALLDGGRIFEIMDAKSVRENIGEFVALCVKYKANIVEQDEKESGLRRLLNLGHTIGHAIEKASGFCVSHGEAVKFGLNFILQASKKLGGDEKDLKKAGDLLAKYDADCKYNARDILPLVKNDKKAEENNINAVFVRRIGDCYVKKLGFREFENLF